MNARFLFVLSVLAAAMGGFYVESARAEIEAIVILSRKQAEKKQTRWTLGEWLRAKQKMRMQDLWLAQNSPSPWEFVLGGDLKKNDEDSPERDRRGQVSLHYRMFGLGGEFELDPRRWNGLFFWRFFGYHQQATMITALGGKQFNASTAEDDPWFFGFQSNLYLLQFFGVEGAYRRIFAETGPWNQTELNVFLELKALRIYGGMLLQPKDAGNSRGYQAGFRFYF